MTQHFTAEAFIKELSTMQSREQLKAYERYFPLNKRNGDTFIGVKMGHIFTLAKRYKEMELHEIEKLLENPVHEMRVGAVSIMDYQAREKKVTEEHRKALFDLYLRRHDRINTWDLVDRSAIYVIGQYLADKPKDTLYKLARAGNMAERRTAILSTAYFMMKQKQVDDTIKIAELLLHDNEDLIHKAVGWMLRVAGGVDEKSLVSFLDAHAIEMPRVMLQYATEKLHKEKKAAYMRLKQPK
jgi:3-methyladenine DNA glycosylase AlkD